MRFMAATLDTSQLKFSGLLTMQIIIDKFSSNLELEFPGNVILAHLCCLHPAGDQSGQAKGCASSGCYNDSASAMEKLDILEAWV